jgi:hypothetical protein
MNVRYRVDLNQIERSELKVLLSGGKHASRKLKRAQILLAADAGASDEEMARSVGGSTVYRTKRRFVEGDLERALTEEPRPGAERKLAGKEEALLVATACASPPAGRAPWTLKLLAGAMVKLTDRKNLSHETVWRRLVEKDLKPWRKDMWCISAGRWRIRRPHGRTCLISTPRRPIPSGRGVLRQEPGATHRRGASAHPAEPGRLERYDYEYCRHGTVNLFIFLDVHRPWRKVKVTERQRITPNACASLSMSIIPMRKPSVWFRTIVDPLRRLPVSSVPARRSQADLATPRVPLHSQTRKLAQHGRDRDRRPAGAMPGPQDRRPQAATTRNRRERSRNAVRSRIKWMFTTDKARANRTDPETSKES